MDVYPLQHLCMGITLSDTGEVIPVESLNCQQKVIIAAENIIIEYSDRRAVWISDRAAFAHGLKKNARGLNLRPCGTCAGSGKKRARSEPQTVRNLRTV